MSWNFKKVGLVSQPDALKAAIKAESCPENVKLAICSAIDSITTRDLGTADKSKLAIVVDTFGHVDENGKLPANSWNYDIKLRVDVVPVLDTPVIGSGG